MLQEVNTDLSNPLVPKAHNSECQIILFYWKLSPQKSVLASFADFNFLHPWH